MATKILPNVLAALPDGSMLALAGQTGSGKSMALRHLVARFLGDWDPTARAFELSVFANPASLAGIYRDHLMVPVAVWQQGESVPTSRAVVLTAGVRDHSVETALNVIQAVIRRGDLVVIDEMHEWHDRPCLTDALKAILTKGARVITTVQRPDDLLIFPQESVQRIWLAGHNVEVQRSLECDMGSHADMVIDGARYRYVPTPMDYWWHTTHPMDRAILGHLGTMRERVARVIADDARRAPRDTQQEED